MQVQRQSNIFRLSSLKIMNADLADLFLWDTNSWPLPQIDQVRLNLGCGEQIIDGFVNIDFLPKTKEILRWGLLNPWPSCLESNVEMAFSEDLLEHFFYGEQLYILCSMNVALKERGVFRVLTPDLDKLMSYSSGFSLSRNANDWLVRTMGARTGGDALNLGMRFSGHRWLHNAKSLEYMAELCGYRKVGTTCAESILPEMSRLNLRDETNSMSFANDLVKERRIRKWQVKPTRTTNAELIEEVAPSIQLYHATNEDPQIMYILPKELAVKDIVLMNFRGTNLSQFKEHSFAKVYLRLQEEKSIYLDSTIRSSYTANILSVDQVRLKLGAEEALNMVRFDPGEKAGDYFTVGPLEIFWREN